MVWVNSIGGHIKFICLARGLEVESVYRLIRGSLLLAGVVKAESAKMIRGEESVGEAHEWIRSVLGNLKMDQMGRFGYGIDAQRPVTANVVENIA